MPIYLYSCSACGQRTEILHGINDPMPSFCPECGAEASLRKGFAAPAVVFKGSGWAKKDRRSASRSSAGRESKDGQGAKDGQDAKDGRDGAADGKGTPSKTDSTSGSGTASGSGAGSAAPKPAAEGT